MVMPIETERDLIFPKRFEHKTVMKCGRCGDEIYSRYSGEFRACSCFDNKEGTGGCAIDETRHYCRWIGSNFYLQDENGFFVRPNLTKGE